MATDDLDDTRVLNALGRLLAAGEPFTALPLVDPATKLFPSATMDVFDGRYPSAAEVSDLEASVTMQAETLTSHGADIDGLTTDVGALETLTASGRLSTSQLSNTYVRFLDENGDPLVGKLVTITVNSVTGEIDDITSEDI